MTQLYASIAIGTAASLLAILLLLLRAEVLGRRAVLALTRWWVRADIRTSGLVLALLSAIAGSAFALVPMEPLEATVPAPAHVAAGASEGDQTLAALRSYVEKTEAGQPSAAAVSPAADDAALPDVSTMIGKLVARLEMHPDDVQGWKMLGWSYLNIGKPEEAARAYETALKLEPGNPETEKALEAAKSALTTSNPLASAGQDSSMIRGMVDQLDARLKGAPKDEAGWVRLMRSRMVLGEEDAARAALKRALSAFASDAAATSRLTAAARELGIK